MSELDHLQKEEAVDLTDTVKVEEVDLTKLKEWAKKMLPNNSMLRALILSQAAQMRRSEALAKMEVFAQLLQTELKSD